LNVQAYNKCWMLPEQSFCIGILADLVLFLCLRIPTNYVTLLGVLYEVIKTLYGQIMSISPSVVCP
jgi:hypothetical protein